MTAELLIFDLDGTLCHTLPLLHEMVYRAMLDSDIEIGSVEELERSLYSRGSMVFEGSRALIPREFADKVDPEKYGIDYRLHYDLLFMESAERVYDGIPELLAELKARGYRLAVLSNKPHGYTVPIIEKAFGKDMFDIVIGSSETIPQKPAADGILYICRELGAKPEEAYLIGDMAADRIAAAAAGARFIAVGWGYGGSELTADKGGVVADTPRDILRLVLEARTSEHTVESPTEHRSFQ